MSFEKKKLSVLVAAISGLACATTLMSSQVVAQEAQITEEVLVTGFRGSLQNSLNAKRNASGIVDAIYAEDIADFPDNNLAESLQRIPGVAISRAGGEGQQISVRGLGPDFTRVRINGMEAMSSTGSTDAIGGNNRGRGFDFNTFTSDLFSNILVRKTNSADVEEGSLGATVELNTARPMDFDEFTLSVSGQAGYNDKAEEVNPKVSFLVANQFSDSFGVLFSLAYAERDILDEGNSTVRWSTAENFGSVDGADCFPTDPADTPEACEVVNGSVGSESSTGPFHPRIPRYDSYTHNIERTGASLGFQFTPTDAIDLGLDILYSKHDATRHEVFMQGVGNSGSIFGSYNLDDYAIQGNTLVYANMPNGTVQAEDRFDELTTDFTQVTLSYKHDLSDRLRINALLGQSKSEFENPVQNTIIMRADNVGLSWDYRGGSDNTQLTFGEGAYQESSWDLIGIRQRPLGTNNEFTSANIGLEFDFDDSLMLKAGIDSKSFDFDSYQSRLSDEGNHGLSIDGYITNYDSGLGDGRVWLVPDRVALVRDNNILGNEGEWELVPRQADIFAVTEDTVSAYAQLVFNTELGDTPFSGDIGFRYYSTDQSSTGWFDTDTDGTDEQVWVDHSYDDILPSMNLRFEPITDVVFRFGASEGIARAGLTNIRADQSVSVSGSLRSINGGNPLLEPTKATSYDAGIELYFSDNSAMSMTVFKKDIESHVQSLRDEKTAAELGIPVAEVEAQCDAGPDGYGPDCNENLLWNRSVPLNGPGGELQGFEWQYQSTFGFLGDTGENFGFIGNYTFVKSQLAYLNDEGEVDVVADLLNLSDTTSSITLYFENEQFSARIALVNRNDYLTDARGRNGNFQEGTYGTSNVDFSASYSVTDNLKLSFEALNLTNEADDQWVDRNDGRLSYYHETGTQFYLGAQYKF